MATASKKSDINKAFKKADASKVPSNLHQKKRY